MSDSDWVVSRDGKRLIGFADQNDAIAAAIKAARNEGCPADVLVQGRDRQFRLEWTSERDS